MSPEQVGDGVIQNLSRLVGQTRTRPSPLLSSHPCLQQTHSFYTVFGSVHPRRFGDSHNEGSSDRSPPSSDSEPSIKRRDSFSISVHQLWGCFA